MLGILLIILVAVDLAFFYPLFKPVKKEEVHSQKYNAQMKKLWTIAQSSMRERKPLRAEKALLTILKFDEKNAAAYNRLGILYAKSQKFDEAIECFEIAQSLDNNPSSLHNAGLIYLETGAYEKAAMAFQQALELEGGLPARYIALSKAQEKLGQNKQAIESLESAYELDRSTSTLRQILAIYEAAEDAEAIAATTARIEAQIAADAAAREAAIKARARAARRRAMVPASKKATKVYYPPAKPAAKTAKPSSKRRRKVI